MASQDWFEKDFYAVLGVAADADAKEIKKRYRKLARDLHPDSKPGDKAAEHRFKEIGEAYAVLSDPEQRKQYDAIRAMRQGGARFTSGGAGGSSGGFEDLLGGLFSGGARDYTSYGGGSPFRGAGGGGGGQQPDIEELLRMFGGAAAGAPGAGGGFGHGQNPFGGGFGGFERPTKGRDRQATATLSFRQAVGGDVVEVRGTDGRTSRARIPAGVKDGATIRIPGKGDPGSAGAPAGDLLIKVMVTPHEVFGRDGDNLTLELPVTFAEAALGETVTVPTFDGGPVKVRLTPGTSSGRVLRVKGRGVKRKDHAGDLLVKVQVIVPQRLSDEARAAVETLRAADGEVDPRETTFRKAAS